MRVGSPAVSTPSSCLTLVEDSRTRLSDFCVATSVQLKLHRKSTTVQNLARRLGTKGRASGLSDWAWATSINLGMDHEE